MELYGRFKEDGSIEISKHNFASEGYLPICVGQTPNGKVFTGYKLSEDGTKIVGVFEDDKLVQRRIHYPSIQDQLDMIYWDKVYGTTVWEETIKAIKEKYPVSE